MTVYSKCPTYKPSGIEWLGDVPRHWRTEKIKYMVSSCSGGTPNTDNSDYWDGDIPWVSAKDMKRSRISTTEDTITDLGLKESASRLIPENTVLMVVRSGILKHTIPVAINTVPVAINQDMKALFVKEGLESEFLYYFAEGMQKTLLPLWAKQGCTVESIDQEFMGNTNLPLPPVPEQKAIAAFLDRAMERIDGLIGKREKLIALLQEKRAALISHAVTKGLNPSAKMKPSGIDWLGNIPAHWEVSPLRYLLSSPLKYGANEVAVDEDNTQPRYVRITDVAENGTLRPETFKSLDWNIAKDYLLEEGDILFARSGATVGKTFMYRADWGTSAFAGYLIRARLDVEKVVANFAQYCTTSDFYKGWISSILVQATIQNVSADKYATFSFPLPPLSEQEAIAAHLDSETKKIDGLMEREQQIIERMKEYRSALISAAVTGKIDVREGV